MGVQNHPRTPTFNRIGYRDRARIELAAEKADDLAGSGGVVILDSGMGTWKWLPYGSPAHHRAVRKGLREVGRYECMRNLGEAMIREYISQDLVEAGLVYQMME